MKGFGYEYEASEHIIPLSQNLESRTLGKRLNANKRVTLTGTLNGTLKGALKGTLNGALKGALKGTRNGALKGAPKGGRLERLRAGDLEMGPALGP